MKIHNHDIGIKLRNQKNSPAGPVAVAKIKWETTIKEQERD